MLDKDAKKILLDNLSENTEKNISIINFVRDYEITEVEYFGSSILVRGISDNKWVYIAIENNEDMDLMLDLIKEDDYCFAMVSNEEMEAILGERETKWVLTCNKLVFPIEKHINQKKLNIDGAILRNLIGSDADYIFRNYEYKEYTSKEYILERITKGISYGIEINGTLVAWILTHDDGAMGMLTVLESFRKKGLAEVLTMKMIEEVRRHKQIPFVAIEPTNVKSMGLAKKLGFVDKGTYNWFEIRNI